MRCVFCKVLGQLCPVVLGLTTLWCVLFYRVFAFLINLTSGLTTHPTWWSLFLNIFCIFNTKAIIINHKMCSSVIGQGTRPLVESWPTWIMRSPSRMRPSLAAMLLGSIWNTHGQVSSEWVTKTQMKINISTSQKLIRSPAYPYVFVLHRNKEDLVSCKERQTWIDLSPSLFLGVLLDPCMATLWHGSVRRHYWPKGMERHSWLSP